MPSDPSWVDSENFTWMKILPENSFDAILGLLDETKFSKQGQQLRVIKFKVY